MATAKQLTYAFEELAPPPTSASKKVPCEVFINHRGPDTKETLASSIYNVLHGMGVQVFLDKEVLDLGDVIPSEIEEAMRTSFLHIAILSPKYAESPWCLAELSFMLKTGNTVFPVFYRVEPSDIRDMKGNFGDAFAAFERKKRYTLEKFEEWKRALYNVSSLSENGYIVKNENDEGMLLKRVVKLVLEHSKNVTLEVAKHPVGLDEMVQAIERSAIGSSQKVHIVGIVGMGGSGKTTLAKELYNKKIFSIYKCSFLFDVGDAAAKNVLHDKQKMLLEELGFKDQSFDNVDKGKAILANCLRSLQVFIVLDNVDHQDQLDALLPRIDSLGWGSLIIITSREIDILKSWGISSIYPMKRLDHGHALQLFCWHAFLQPSPQDGFECLVEMFVKFCNGLPLSLKVLGGLLYGKSKEYWDSQFNNVSKILPNDIKNTLKVSFDALDEEEQETFLDIACFFIGEEKSLAIAVWDGSRLSGVYSWETLEGKCLVELDGRNNIRMHDHLRDLGKEIAKIKSPHRLWSQEEITEIQKHAQERVLIRGIKVETAHPYPRLPPSFYSQCGRLLEECMKFVRNYSQESRHYIPPSLGLEILVTAENHFTEELAALSTELVWLRWFGFQQRALPLWLPLKNLRVLELHSPDNLKELWRDTVNPPSELRELVITGGESLLSLPRSIGCLNHLKKISLINCKALTYIEKYNVLIGGLPDEFCLLQSLEHLEFHGCFKLASLPSNFGNLTNLRHLDLASCRELSMLPVSFKRLIHLQHINLASCSNLAFTLYIFKNMRKLEFLNFYGCARLQELPLHVPNQLSLRYLNVNFTSLRKLPSNIGQLSKLEDLSIGSKLLTSLPTSVENLSSLTTLEIDGCSLLESLPESMGNLHLLEELKIISTQVKSLPKALAQLCKLQHLHIDDCPVTELAFLSESFSSSLCNLKWIDIQRTHVSRISISQQCCPSLETLDLSRNYHLVEIESLPISVKAIKLNNCKMLKSISGICGLVNLQKLIISGCGEDLDELPSFAKLVSLKQFEISQTAAELKRIEGFENCSSLETLRACTCSKVPTIQSLELMDRLTTLELSGAFNISAIEPCLQTIKKWPSESIICARTELGVDSVKKSFDFPGLTLVDSCVEEIKNNTSNVLRLKCGQRPSSNDAAMVCFVINSSSEVTTLSLETYRRGTSLMSVVSSMSVGEGTWLWIGVFTQVSLWIRAEEYVLNKSWSSRFGSNPPDREVRGMLVMGQEKGVMEAFYKFLEHFGKSTVL